MSKYAFLGIASILLAAGNAAKAHAETVQDTMGPESTPEGEPRKPRGRPAGTTNKVEETATTGPNDEERLAANKQLIAPLVAAPASQGEEVKKVIAKYSATGLKGLPADKQADFEKDIAALTY